MIIRSDADRTNPPYEVEYSDDADGKRISSRKWLSDGEGTQLNPTIEITYEDIPAEKRAEIEKKRKDLMRASI